MLSAAAAEGLLLRLPALLASTTQHAASWRRPWRRCACLPHGSPCHAAALSTLSPRRDRHRILFLGTPSAAALVLQELLQAASAPDSCYEVAAVVSRPSGKRWLPDAEPAACGEAPSATLAPPAERLVPAWSRHSPSAVEVLARSSGLPPDRILCPASAKEPAFLDALRDLRPDLAITAAYGAMLPQAFLDIPRCGTLNIHPSLLPRYRGAAPVQRALQDGCAVTGVSLAFTVLKCDAGPVLEQRQVAVPLDEQAPELTERLFRLGASMLLGQLPRVLAGEVGPQQAAPQDEALATYAPKILRQEAYLDFARPALACHDHVRAMAGWPGARASLLLEERDTGTCNPLEFKVLRTRVEPGPPPARDGGRCGKDAPAAARNPLPPGTSAQVVCTNAGELLVPCGDGKYLQILEVGRRPGGASTKSQTAKNFIAGLSKRRLYLPSRT